MNGWLAQWSGFLAAAFLVTAAGCAFDDSAEGNTGALPAPAPESPTDPNTEEPARPAASEPGRLLATATARPPLVDDDALDPTPWSLAYELEYDIADSPALDADPSYQASAHARLAALHTENMLFLLAHVSDDEVLAGDGIEVYLGDGVEFFVGPSSGGPQATGNLRISGQVHLTKLGYAVELGISKSELSVVGDRIDFNLALNDADAGGRAYGIWHGCASVDAECDVDIPSSTLHDVPGELVLLP